MSPPTRILGCDRFFNVFVEGFRIPSYNEISLMEEY